MMALYDKKKTVGQFGLAVSCAIGCAPYKQDRHGAFFFVLGQMGPFCLGFSADRQNPSIFPQSDQIPIKNAIRKKFIIFLPILCSFIVLPHPPFPILAL